jgi:hypothetical protein
MTDMSTHPAKAAAEIPLQDDAVAASFLRGLEQIAGALRDNLDHPEVWAVLKDVAEQDDVSKLLRLLRDIRPQQYDLGVIKTLDIVAGVIVGLGIDKATGLEMLGDLEGRYSLCSQVAGAYFFVERAYDAVRSPDLSDRFCESPFIKFETLIDGTVAPCCSIWTQKRLGQLDTQTAEEIWNGADAQEMRESILDGSFRYCNKRRCTLINEDKLPMRDEVADPVLRKAIDEGLTRVEESPRWLFLAHDASCNLACPSCRDSLMGADEAQKNRFDKIEQTVFQPLLNGEDEVTISVSGQGDAWSSPHYRSILRYLADHDLNVRLNIHTNAMLMTEARWKQYEGLVKYQPLVDVSIDSCTPWVYEMLRRPGKWDRLEPNLAFLGRQRAAGTFREYHLNATIQLDNFHEMPALVDYAERIGADTMRLYMMQNTGSHISAWYASKNVGDSAHKLHLAFLETLRDPRLGRPTAHLYDVAALRALAMEMTLPTDALGADYTLATLVAAIQSAWQDGGYDRAAALCAGGRIRFPKNAALLRTEAKVIEALGFIQIAGYRLREAGVLESSEARLAAA